MADSIRINHIKNIFTDVDAKIFDTLFVSISSL